MGCLWLKELVNERVDSILRLEQSTRGKEWGWGVVVGLGDVCGGDIARLGD